MNVSNKLTKKETHRLEHSIRCSISGQMYLNNLEELSRSASVERHQKILVNRTINALRVKEKLFDELDEQIPEELFGQVLKEYDEFIIACSRLHPKKLKEATEIIKKI